MQTQVLGSGKDVSSVCDEKLRHAHLKGTNSKHHPQHPQLPTHIMQDVG